MQELKLYRWCDVCHQQDGTLTEVVMRYEVSVTIIGGSNKPLTRVLELCDVHAKPVDELRETLRAFGLPPGTQPATEQPELPLDQGTSAGPRFECPLCHRYLSKTGLVGHLVRIHGLKPLKQPKVCPDCGRRFAVASTMGVHRAVSHDFDIIDAMMARHKAKED